MYCKKCGNEIAEGMRFCPYCGAEAPNIHSGPSGGQNGETGQQSGAGPNTSSQGRYSYGPNGASGYRQDVYGNPQRGGYTPDTGKKVSFYFAPPARDEGSFLWGLFGFLLMPIGIFLCLYWKDTSPEIARSIKIGAIVQICVLLIWFILAIAGVASIGFGFSSLTGNYSGYY